MGTQATPALPRRQVTCPRSHSWYEAETSALAAGTVLLGCLAQVALPLSVQVVGAKA